MLHLRERKPLREGLPQQRERCRRKGKTEKEGFKERATTVENLGTRPRSAPSKGAKGKARAKARPRDKEEYGK